MITQVGSSDIELKPCPFCGSEAHIIDDGIPETHYKAVVCDKCQGMTAYSYEESAIQAWNTRA